MATWYVILLAVVQANVITGSGDLIVFSGYFSLRPQRCTVFVRSW